MATPENVVHDQWKEKLDMSPPQKTIAGGAPGTATRKEDASLDEVKDKNVEDHWPDEMTRDTTAATATDEQKIVLYLYGFGFLQNASHEDRVAGFHKFMVGDAKKRMMERFAEDVIRHFPASG